MRLTWVYNSSGVISLAWKFTSGSIDVCILWWICNVDLLVLTHILHLKNKICFRKMLVTKDVGLDRSRSLKDKKLTSQESQRRIKELLASWKSWRRIKELVISQEARVRVKEFAMVEERQLCHWLQVCWFFLFFAHIMFIELCDLHKGLKNDFTPPLVECQLLSLLPITLCKTGIRVAQII